MTGPGKSAPPRELRLTTTPTTTSRFSVSCGPLASKVVPSREFRLADTPTSGPALSKISTNPFVTDTAEDDEPRVSEGAAQKALMDLVAQAYEPDVSTEQGSDTVPGFAQGIRLLPHQVSARAWMHDREEGTKTGGILADDMGLGKTIQVLVRIADCHTEQSPGPTLIVCPASIVWQWVSEIQTILPSFDVIEYHGPKRTKDARILAHANIVVTSYNIAAGEHARLNAEEYLASDGSVDTPSTEALFGVKWHRLVLDEAHAIKNQKSKTAAACFGLRAKYRWCVTGTPIQNCIEEMFSYLHFLHIKPLNDWKVFQEKIEKPVKSGRPGLATKRLQVVLKVVMLRRIKEGLVSSIPPKTVIAVQCHFDAMERDFYDTLAHKLRARLRELKDLATEKQWCPLMVMLLRLRQVCDHPSLVSEAYLPDEVDKGESDSFWGPLSGASAALSELRLDETKCSFCQAVVPSYSVCEGCSKVRERGSRFSFTSNCPPTSAKLRKIVTLLRDIDHRSRGTEKTIVFSQFNGMLTIIGTILKAENIKFTRYDGSMSKEQRDRSLDKIKRSKDMRCFLVSFKAGGSGLNLAACNNVILVEPSWNPALEDQAFDRVHRIGQERPVTIYKLTVPNTVEERIYKLQEKKRELARATVSGGAFGAAKLSVEELLAVFWGAKA